MTGWGPSLGGPKANNTKTSKDMPTAARREEVTLIRSDYKNRKDLHADGDKLIFNLTID